MTGTHPTTGDGRSGFRRELGLLDSAMLVIGSMIGSGIFIVSADIARTVGGGGWLLLVWAVTGVMTVMAALCYGELAGLMPRAGGQYVFLREAYGPMTGFLYGWTLFLVIQTGTIAAVAMAFAKFCAVLVPALSAGMTIAAPFRIGGQQAVAIASIVILTFVNSRGIREGKMVQDIFTAAKVLALAALVAAGIATGLQSDVFAANMKGFWTARWTVLSGGTVASVRYIAGAMMLPAIAVAMVGSLFSSDAWFNVTFAAGEVKNPRRNVPLALILGTAAVTALYCAVNAAYLTLLPLEGTPGGADVAARGIQFAADDRVGTAAAQAIFGGAGAAVMAALIMISTFGCNNGIILSGARVYYAMSGDGLFFRRAGVLNGRGVPAAALAFQALWACLLCLSGTYGDLLDYVIFAVLVFYALTVAGLLVLRRRNPGAQRPVRVPGYPLVPLAYVALAAFISINLLIFKPAYTWPGLLIVLAGVPVYFIWRRIPPRASEGRSGAEEDDH